MASGLGCILMLYCSMHRGIDRCIIHTMRTLSSIVIDDRPANAGQYSTTNLESIPSSFFPFRFTSSTSTSPKAIWSSCIEHSWSPSPISHLRYTMTSTTDVMRNKCRKFLMSLTIGMIGEVRIWKKRMLGQGLLLWCRGLHAYYMISFFSSTREDVTILNYTMSDCPRVWYVKMLGWCVRDVA